MNGNLTRWEEPMSDKAVSTAKMRFLQHHATLEECTCFDCPRVTENTCSLQFDLYNTAGDCLLEK